MTIVTQAPKNKPADNKLEMLTDETLKSYFEPMTGEQVESILKIRSILMESGLELEEKIDEGKWFGGLLTYALPSGQFMFALGPRPKGFTTFHMMPFYASRALHDRHGPALKRFLTGKSCIKFKRADDLPWDAISDIVVNGAKGMISMEKAAI